MESNGDIPELKGEALEAATYRGGHLQIIASAGAGKTEVVSQRVRNLLIAGESPASVVAFTFTERAAASLKARIEKRVASEPQLGQPFLDKLNGMFVGTIHSYCFRVLQQHVEGYETYDVLDDHKLTAFLTREFYRLNMQSLGPKFFAQIQNFARNVQVVENELIELTDLEDPFREVYEAYLGALADNRFLTYGQIISRAVVALKDPRVFERVHNDLRHLIVDEYQDINPAQEELIRVLATPPVHLCVVGDDDQSIYQWRGSDVGNIVGFTDRYPSVKQFTVEKNRRSRPEIIALANPLGAGITGRLPKEMKPHRSSSETENVVCWTAESDTDEAALIATAVRAAHDVHGYRYRDIAILCRGKVSFPALLDALSAQGIPVQPGGRTNLFMQEDADLFGRTICWLVGYDWRVSQYGWNVETIAIDDLLVRYEARFTLTADGVRRVKTKLLEWQQNVDDGSRPANLVRDLYELLQAAGVERWDLSDEWTVNRLGTLARCSQVLADYETARRRARPDHANPGEIRGGMDRGRKYYEWLARYVQNWARGAYEDFEGEENVDLDAVDLTTVHQAKGLEWPIVFVPALKSDRFPSSKTGSARTWFVPDHLFNASRYEGSLNDERRLFYVAITRARDFLSLSTFERMARAAKPSPFLLEVTGGALGRLSALPPPPPPERADDESEVLELSFSDLAAYSECGLSYRYRRLIGFQPPLVPELGYGKAVHHVLRRVAEHVRRYQRKPTPHQLDKLFDSAFYLPAANKAGFRQMKAQGRKLVDKYLDEWEPELHRVWEVERPFELHLGDATISGRADVILDESEEGPPRLSIVDYKTAADGHDSHHFQLQVYTDAGRREGHVVESAFVHDLRGAVRHSVPVEEDDVEGAEQNVRDLVKDLRARRFLPISQIKICGRCDVNSLCQHRAV